MRRHVTTVAIFLDDNKTNDDGDGKENGTHFRHPTDEQFGHLDIFFSNYYNLQSVYFELNLNVYLFPVRSIINRGDDVKMNSIKNK